MSGNSTWIKDIVFPRRRVAQEVGYLVCAREWWFRWWGKRLVLWILVGINAY